MEKERTQLVRIPDAAYTSRSQILYNASVHTPQYTVSPTALGEYAVHFTADWFSGLFSVTDLSPEWAAFIQQQVRGGWSEWTYAGDAPFSNVPWDNLPWNDRVTEWVFSQVRLDSQLIGGLLGDLADPTEDTDVSTWGKTRKRLPFQKTLALPDANTSTL